MASPAAKLIFFLSLLTRLFLFAPSFCFHAAADPVPAPWPHQFHSILFMNRSGKLEMIDLWYDWAKGRNFNIIQHQLGKLTYDLEWNNGTSFIYTLDQNQECKALHFEVGILRPNWLDGATYLGRRYVVSSVICGRRSSSYGTTRMSFPEGRCLGSFFNQEQLHM